MRLFTFPRRGRTSSGALPVSLLREQDPNQNLIAEKLAHRAVGWFAALRHFDWYRSVLPPARCFRLHRLFRRRAAVLFAPSSQSPSRSGPRPTASKPHRFWSRLEILPGN